MTPDTVIVLVTHRKLVVRESADEVVSRVIAYRQTVGCGRHIGGILPPEAEP